MGDNVGLDREQIPAAVELEELVLGRRVLVHAHHESVVCPRTVDIGDDGMARTVAGDVVEHDRGTVVHTAGGTTCRTDIGLGEDLVGHVDELTLLLKRGEEGTKILVHLV